MERLQPVVEQTLALFCKRAEEVDTLSLPLSLSSLEAFRKQYPVLSNFVGGWFPDADFEALQDEEVAQKFATTSKREHIKSVLEEGQRLLLHTPFPWDELSQEANRYFTSSEEAHKWLSEVLKIIEITEASR